MFYFLLCYSVPPPLLVFIVQVPMGTVPAGETVSLGCAAISPCSITTPVVTVIEWTVGDGQPLPDTSRFQISSPSNVTSVLTINPALMTDTGSYTCSAYYEPESTGRYLYSSPSNSGVDTEAISVSGTLKQLTLFLPLYHGMFLFSDGVIGVSNSQK